MLKNPFLFLGIACLAILFQSCNDYKKTDTGLKYKIIQDSAGNTAKEGDMVLAHLKFQNEKDTFDSYKRGHPVNIYLGPSYKGSLEEGLTFASKGDSISIQVLNDSLYKNAFRADSLPKEIKPGSYTTFNVRVVDIISKSQLEADQKKRGQERTKQAMAYMKEAKKQILDSSQAKLKADDSQIQKYLKKNNITNAQKTESGVYYVISQEGNDPEVDAGDTVSVQYTGKLLSGKEFDKSTPDRPLKFQVGVGSVIPGFDEAMEQLKQGSKATIYIPSPLAYGEQGVKISETEYAIPQNAILIFELDVQKVTKME